MRCWKGLSAPNRVSEIDFKRALTDACLFSSAVVIEVQNKYMRCHVKRRIAGSVFEFAGQNQDKGKETWKISG